jgi:hypothetical protein
VEEAYADVSTDADAYSRQIPADFNPDTHEVQLIITTVENGRNRGRLYVHVLEEHEAQDWITKLQAAVIAAKQRDRAQRLKEIYGHSRHARTCEYIYIYISSRGSAHVNTFHRSKWL